MIEEDRIWLVLKYLAGGLLIAMLLMLTVPAIADDGHGHNDDDTNVALDSVVNNAIKGGSTHTFSLSGSDADINQCRYTVGAVTVQWTRNNPWCEAMDLVRMGFIDAGVLKFCTDTSVGEMYTDLEDCQIGMVRVVTAPEPEPVVTEPDNDDDDAERRDMIYEELLAEQQDLKQQIQQIQQQPPQPVYIDDSADRRARAKAAGDAVRKQAGVE